MTGSSLDITFPEALKRQLGRGFFSFPELLIGLSTAGAMGGFPPLQYMMQALPASGFLRPLMMADSLAEIDRLTVEFVKLTGFGKECAGYLFGSFAYALGLSSYPPSVPPVGVDTSVSEECVDADGGVTVEEPQGEYGRRPVAPWDTRWSVEEKCRFLTSLITVNRENERRLGLRVSAPACVSAEKHNLRLTAELSRDEPGATGALYYAIYDRDGKIADTAMLGAICYDNVTPLPVSVTVPLPPHRVAAIYLYWIEE